MSRCDDLMDALLADELTTDGQRELEALLAAQPELVAEAAAQWRLHRLLPVAARGPTGDRFAHGVARALKPASNRFQPQLRARVRRAHRRSNLLRWAAFAAAVVVVTVLAVSQWPSPRPDRSVTTQVHIVASPGGALIDDTMVAANHIGDVELRLGNRIASPDGQPVVLAYLDGTRLTLQPASAIELAACSAPTPIAERKQLRLLHGGLNASVARQPTEATMLIATPHALAEIVGTEFSLSIDGDATRLETSHGAVALTRTSDGVTVTVAAGEFAIAAPGGDMRVRPLSSAAVQSALIPAGHVLLAYDIEDGTRPADLQDGDVVPGPVRAGNRFCIKGIEKPNLHDGEGAPRKQEIWFEQRHAVMFAYVPGALLSFDCWLGEASAQNAVTIWDDTLKMSMVSTFPPLVPGRWQRVTVRLDDLRADADASITCKSDDQIANLVITTVEGQGGSLYIDNLEITAPR